MNGNHFHEPSSTIHAIDINKMTVRELGELAEKHGLKLLDVLTL